MPSWFLDNRPMDPHHIFAAATATAPKLELASSKATSQARGDIAAKIEVRFQGLTKQFQEEVGSGPNAESVSQFTKAYKSVVNRTINGSEVVKRKVKREDGGYRAYVLLRMPIGDAQEKLLDKIETQRNAYTRFRSSQAFEELEQEVENHRQREEEREARQQGRSSAQTEQTQPSEQGQQTQPEQTTDAQVTDRQAEDAESRSSGDAPTEDQVQAPESTEREAETGESRTEGDAPTEDQIEAAGEKTEQPADQPQEGGSEMSKAQKIESRVRAAADPWMGTPYSLGGESKSGVDCSALVRAVYEDAFNIGLPRTTGQQVSKGSTVDRSSTPPSSLRPGDLIFFRTGEQAKHVGIYLENRKFVHASSSQGVTISPLKYDYWQNHYWQTRRLSVL